MTRTSKKLKRGFTESLDNHLIENSRIVSIVRSGNRYIFLDKKARVISYTELNSTKEGKTPKNADQCTDALLAVSKMDPFLVLRDGNYIRCSAIEAIDNYKGPDYKGLIFRGIDDSILAFLAIPTAKVRSLVISLLHSAIESYEMGKFSQLDLTEIL